MSHKSVTALIIGLLSFIWGSITPLVVVFWLLIFLDYLTGSLGSIKEGKEFTKQKVRDGLIKKAGYIIFWILAVIADFVIIQAGPEIGLTLSTPIASLIATCWLIGTEGTSIIQNLVRMGVLNLPPWLAKFFGAMTKLDPEGGGDNGQD